MATIWEETKVQTAKMKGRPLKEKLGYFWEYYKIQTAIIVGCAALIISIIHAIATSKDYALSIIIINSIANELSDVEYKTGTGEDVNTGSNATLCDKWIAELSELIEYNPKKYEITIDSSMSLGTNTNTANAEYANSQKLAAMMSSKTIDVLIANTELFERYAQNEYYFDLRDLYSADEIASFEEAGLLYYTDASTFADYEDTNLNVFEDQAKYKVDHSNPESIENPIPVGFFLKEGTSLGDCGIYSYLTADDLYQGYPQQGVMGIPINTPRVEAAKIAVEYFLEGAK